MLYQVAGLTWLRLPWTPIALIGTAVAFLIGFQNNAAYGRAWEARQIWGGIVNESRTWAIWVRDMVVDDGPDASASEEELQGIRRELVLDHVAWLTTLRYSMRQNRPWEVFNQHGPTAIGMKSSVFQNATSRSKTSLPRYFRRMRSSRY